MNEIHNFRVFGFEEIKNSKKAILELTSSLGLVNQSPFLWEEINNLEDIKYVNIEEFIKCVQNIKTELLVFPEITVPEEISTPEGKISCWAVGKREDSVVFVIKDKAKFLNHLDELASDYYIFDHSFKWIIAVTHEPQDKYNNKVIIHRSWILYGF